MFIPLFERRISIFQCFVVLGYIITCFYAAADEITGPCADDTIVDPGQVTFREPVKMQNEEIDPYTGNLTITNVDLELPGDGGLSASVIRTYKSNRLIDTFPRDCLLGHGWTIHYGILTEKGGSVIIELQDGTQSVAVKEPEGGGHFITKDFWKLYYPPSSPPILTMTDGTIITFGKKKVLSVMPLRLKEIIML